MSQFRMLLLLACTMMPACSLRAAPLHTPALRRASGISMMADAKISTWDMQADGIPDFMKKYDTEASAPPPGPPPSPPSSGSRPDRPEMPPLGWLFATLLLGAGGATANKYVVLSSFRMQLSMVSV